MKKGIKKHIKPAAANKAKLPKKTSNLRELASKSDKGAVLVKLTKSGEAMPRKSKKGATHIVLETNNGGAIAEPLTRAPKPPKELRPAGREPIGAQPEEKATQENGKWHPPIPPDCTYAAYQWQNGNLFMTPVSSIDDLRDFRGGRLLLGKLRYGEDLRILWPEEEAGNIIEWKSGRTVFAEGKDPATMKSKEKAAKAAAERLANPPAHVKEAFAAQVQKRKAAPGPRPGDVAGKIQNGVRKPGEGGKTARVWEICDELFAKLGRCPTKAEVLAIAVDKEKANPGMAGTNFSYWRRFYGRS